MKMNFLIAGLLLCSLLATAQIEQDTTRSAAMQKLSFIQSYKPVLQLSREQIQHFPYSNLMEVLNGQFPFMFSSVPTVSEYLFVVDGNVIIDPQSLHASLIKLIEYYPVAFTIGYGSMSKKGTFIITTEKVSSSSLQYRSQSGIIFPNDRYTFQHRYDPNTSQVTLVNLDASPGFYTNHEISTGKSGRLWNWAAAGSYLQQQLPVGVAQISDEIKTIKEKFKQWKFSGNVCYRPNDKLSLTSSVYLISQPKTKPPFFGSPSDVSYQNGNLGIQYLFTPRLQNELSFSLVNYTGELNSPAFFNPGTGTSFPGSSSTSKWKRIWLSEKLHGKISTGSENLEIHLSAGIRYLHETWRRKIDYKDPQNGLPGYTDTDDRAENTSLAVLPEITVKYKNTIQVSAGLSYDNWKASFWNNVNQPSSFKLFPYAGFQWSVFSNKTNEAGALSQLILHSTFGRRLVTETFTNPLENYSVKSNRFEMPGSTNTGIPNQSRQPYPAFSSFNWINGLNIGLWQDRLILGINYQTDWDKPYDNGVPLPFASFRNVLVVSKSVCFLVTTRPIVKENFEWSIQGTMGFQKHTVKNNSDPEFVLSAHNKFYSNNDKTAWKGGFRSDLTAGRFFAQASVLLHFNEWYREGYFDPNQGKYQSNYALNFLSAGYRFSFAKIKWLPSVDASLQTKNLGLMKTSSPYSSGPANYYRYRTIVLGFIANIK